MLKTSVQHRLLNALPDDRPITAIQVIEHLEKCPRGFSPIHKTYDQDQDADLRESSILFKSSSARYLCVSKTEGLPNFVVQDFYILNDKNNPPKGFSLLTRTADTEQKAWKKKQLCYKLIRKQEAIVAITDIIVCSRLKKAPDGFKLAGELNGVTICFKMGNVQDGHSSPTANPPTAHQTNPLYPTIGGNNGGDDHDYEILMPPGPVRPAPRPPTTSPLVTQSTNVGSGGGGGASGVQNALDGVPFMVNPKFMSSATADRFQLPSIKAKTMTQILRDYDYPFTLERQN